MICCLVVGLCLLVAGCGDDESSDPSSAQPAATTDGSGGGDGTEPTRIEKRTGGWTGEEAISHDVARTACGYDSPQEAAKGLGLPRTSDESTVAEKYSKSFPSDQRQPAIEGCLAGLRGQ